jgi:hypothetical protein
VAQRARGDIDRVQDHVARRALAGRNTLSLIDRDGRLFGRINLIDAIAMAMVLGLILVGYGAFTMFRSGAAPRITAISPTQVPEKQPGFLRITGEDFRPFLEASFGTVPANFFVESPTSARVLVPDLRPGTYELTLFDKGRVVFTKPAAVTVMGAEWKSLAEIDVQVLGTFTGMNADEARAVRVGLTFALEQGSPAGAQVLAVFPPTPETRQVKVFQRDASSGFITVPVPNQVRVRALIKLRCTVASSREECRVGDAIISQDRLLILPESGGSKPLRFVIDEVRPADAALTFPPSGQAIAIVQVRFVATAGVLDVMNVGDIDLPGAAVVAEADRAQLTRIGSDRQATSAQLILPNMQVQQPAVAVTGTVRVPVVYATTGWTYKDRTVKAGGVFHFETVAAGMSGVITEITLEPKK